jgi:DNA-binding CsgD family transcriptional regulator
VATLSAEVLAAIVDGLAMAVLVFRRNRLIYANAAAKALVTRLRSSHHIELEVMLRDHVSAVLEHRDRDAPGPRQPIVTLLTATDGEPFYVYVTPLGNTTADLAVSIRGLGADIDAFRRRYRLSAREAQVAELVLHGYRNTEIAATLGIAPATTKKHLTRIFDKVGVDTRSQLQTRLA